MFSEPVPLFSCDQAGGLLQLPGLVKMFATEEHKAMRCSRWQHVMFSELSPRYFLMSIHLRGIMF